MKKRLFLYPFFLILLLSHGFLPSVGRAVTCAQNFQRLKTAFSNAEKVRAEILEKRQQLADLQKSYEEILQSPKKDRGLLTKLGLKGEFRTWSLQQKKLANEIANIQNRLYVLGEGYAVTPMKGKFYGETMQIPEGTVNWPGPARYFSEGERDRYEVFVVDGLLQYTSGRIVHGERLNIAMTHEGKIYVFDEANTHSAILNGLPLASAGEANIPSGKVEALGNFTGHYETPWGHFLQLKKELKKRKANLKDTKFQKFRGFPTSF